MICWLRCVHVAARGWRHKKLSSLRLDRTRVQIAIDVELQEIAGRIAGAAWAACRLRLDATKPCRHKVQLIDEGVDEPP
jgi:hypothetical protein